MSILQKIAGIAAVCLMAFYAFPYSASAAGHTQTLSPYFFVEGNGDGKGEQFPLLDTKVDADISGVIAQVKVKQRYANRGDQPIHARYVFPASTRAAVHGLTMTIGDRVIHAQIKEKQEAKKIHNEAKAQGKSTSLLEQNRPNVFTMNVANILPGDVIDVELEYSELLVPEDGVYEFVYPTVVGPRYSNAAADSGSDAWIANPYLKKDASPRTTFDMRIRLAAGMPLQDVSCPSHNVAVSYESDSIASISLDDKEFGGDRDYILHYRLTGQAIASGLLLMEGKDENFFLLMAQPPKRTAIEHIPGREYLFVVDVSGSMHGFPLDTSKALVGNLLRTLRPDDRFNILFFSGGNTILSEQPLTVTPENINRAMIMLSTFDGRGGTELLPALQTALALPKEQGYSRSIVVITDGYVQVEREAFDLIRNKLGESNLFAFGIGAGVNRYLIEGLAKAGEGEPFIVTDPKDAKPVAERLRQYISSPVLTDIKVEYDGFAVYDLEPVSVPDLFAARPVLVFGKWRGERKGSITVSGTSGTGAYKQSFSIEKTVPAKEHEGLKYLWARERLARISDHSGWHEDSENKGAVVELGLKYSLLTAHTSFVAVDTVVRNPKGAGNNVKQPLPLPKGVSERAVADSETLALSSFVAEAAPMSYFGTPEPEFWILLALAGLAAVSALSPSRRAALAGLSHKTR